MKKNYTDITVVLDRSGSMETIRDATIEGFNKFLRDQQALTGAGEATIGLVQFDDQYEVVYTAKPIKDAPALTTTTFVPRGWTALLDAIGRTINTTGARYAAMPEDQRPEKVMIIIMTDGHENRSTEFVRDQKDNEERKKRGEPPLPAIFDMINTQRDVYKWEFIFLAANQDAIQTGRSFGITAGKSMSYAASREGTQNTFSSMSSNMCMYRATKGVDAARLVSDFKEDDRKKAMTK